MGSFLHLSFYNFDCRALRTSLALVWISGLLSGVLFGISAGESLQNLYYIDVGTSTFEFFRLIILRLLLLLFCFASIYFSQRSILFVLLFFSAFFFSLSVASFYFASGTSAWLWSLLMFFGNALILSSYWLALFFSLDSRSYRQAFLISMASILFISLLDYLWITPFMAKLI